MAEFRDISQIAASAISGHQQGQLSAAQAMQNRLAKMQLAQAPAQMQREAQADTMRNRLLEMQVAEAEQAPAVAKQDAQRKRDAEIAVFGIDVLKNMIPALEQVPPEQQPAEYEKRRDAALSWAVQNKILTEEEAQQRRIPFEKIGGISGIKTIVGEITGQPEPAYSKDLTIVRVRNPQTGKMEDRFAQVGADKNVDIKWNIEVPEDRDQALKELKFQMEQKEKQQAALNSVTAEIDQAGRMVDQAKLARDRTDWTSTGWFAQLSGNIGGTPAAELGALVDSMKAKLGFEELRKMREQSPTGGALGQVTEKELTFLQSVIENLDPERVGPAEFKRKLDNIISRFERVQQLAQMERDILSGAQFNQAAFDRLDIDPRAEAEVEKLMKVVSGKSGKDLSNATDDELLSF